MKATQQARIDAGAQDADGFTVADAAQVAFEPWTDKSISPPGANKWATMQEASRIAYAIMFKTKAELMAAVGSVGPDSAMGSIEEMDHAAGILKAMTTILEAASVRMLISLAAAGEIEDAQIAGGLND